MARFLAVAVAAAVIVVGAASSWRTGLTTKRDVITSSPGVGPLFGRADIALARGKRLCVSPVFLTSQTAHANIVVSSPTHRVVGLWIEASAPGYRSSIGPISAPAGGYVPITAVFAPPTGTRTGRVCFVNGSRTAVGFLGTDEPQSLTAATTTIDGRPVEGRDTVLLLLEARPRSVGSRLGVIFHRASGLTGGVVPNWLLWPVMVAMLLVVPVAVLAAFAFSLRREGSR
jgi:hypothetical protein